MVEMKKLSQMDLILNTGDGKAYFQKPEMELECDEVNIGYLRVSAVKDLYLLESMYIDFGCEDWDSFIRVYDNYQELMEKINEITQETLERQWR